MKMRLSSFGYIKDLDEIAKAGYDCAELHIHEIMALDNAGYKAALAKVRDAQVACEVFDNPVPLDQCICDPCFDFEYYRDFLHKGAQRSAKMGARYYIFGNGKTRSLPAAGDIECAKEKVTEFINMMCDIAAVYNITVLIEPLAPRVSNVFLSIPETQAYIKKLGKPNLKALLDYRWFMAQKRPFEEIVQYADLIKHVHIDNPLYEFPKRLVPKVDDGNDYSPLIGALKKICYKGIISVEANIFENFGRDIRDGIAFFKSFGITSYRNIV